ncbi:MAG: peptidoglycan DD-metalloendopeptidase family protein [Magnetococcales bacterium]|nr:peptidoglycan DD-metalloendopeptidase family protein [Magnetococcales bacterium]
MFSRLEQQKRRSFPSSGRKRSILNRRSGRSYLLMAGVLTLSLMAAHRALDASTGSEKNHRIQTADQTIPWVPFPAAVPRRNASGESRTKPETPEPPAGPYVPPFARLSPKPLASNSPVTTPAEDATKTETSKTETSDIAKTAAQVAQSALEVSRRVQEALQEETTKIGIVAKAGGEGASPGPFVPPTPQPLPLATIAKADKADTATSPRLPTPPPRKIADTEKIQGAVAPPLPPPLPITTTAEATIPAAGPAAGTAAGTASRATVPAPGYVAMAEPPPLRIASPDPAVKPQESTSQPPQAAVEVNNVVALPAGKNSGPSPIAAAAQVTTATETPRSKANHTLVSQMQQTFKSAHRTVKDFVRDGDHLAAILGRNEVDHATSQEVADAARPVYDLAHHLQPGKGFRLAFGSDGELTALSYPVNDEETFLLTRDDNNRFVPKMIERKLEHRIRAASSILSGSLFVAGRKVGLSQQMSIKLANLFEWDVDFTRDIRAGDRFTIVYEEYLENGRPVRDGNILAAEFINQGHSYRVIRYTDPSGRTGYFDPNGQNVQKMFIRAPVDFSRISSQFSMNRKHPVFGFSRAHKGVDYAAPVGTLVRAAGDGVVTFRSRKSSFGNLVVIRHNTKYSTGYAHLEGFASGLHVGSRVRQGEIIGRVGMTGVTTGPHLHYEVLLNGEAINPLSIQSPAAMPVVARYMPDFRNKSKQLVAMLDRSETVVASLAAPVKR